jgi:hypothetical protein
MRRPPKERQDVTVDVRALVGTSAVVERTSRAGGVGVRALDYSAVGRRSRRSPSPSGAAPALGPSAGLFADSGADPP